MPAHNRQSNQRPVRNDGLFEDEYEALNDKGADHMEIIDLLIRADEQRNSECYFSGFQVTSFP